MDNNENIYQFIHQSHTLNWPLVLINSVSRWSAWLRYRREIVTLSCWMIWLRNTCAHICALTNSFLLARFRHFLLNENQMMRHLLIVVRKLRVPDGEDMKYLNILEHSDSGFHHVRDVDQWARFDVIQRHLFGCRWMHGVIHYWSTEDLNNSEKKRLHSKPNSGKMNKSFLIFVVLLSITLVVILFYWFGVPFCPNLNKIFVKLIRFLRFKLQ